MSDFTLQKSIDKETCIRAIVSMAVQSYASGFADRHRLSMQIESLTHHDATSPFFQNMVKLCRMIAYCLDRNLSGTRYKQDIKNAEVESIIGVLIQPQSNSGLLNTIDFWNKICKDSNGFNSVSTEIVAIKS